jgi:hypothetical protein
MESDPERSGVTSSHPLCLRCGQNPQAKSMCWECSGHGIFAIDPDIPRPCSTCDNKPYQLRTGEDTCPECGLHRPVYRPRHSEQYRDDYVDCLLCHGTRHLEVEPGKQYDCPECRTEGMMLPADNQRVLTFLFEQILQISPLAEVELNVSVTIPRISGLTLVAALQKWPQGVVHEASRSFRYYVEPHLSQQTGKIVDDAHYLVEQRRYDIWQQSKHTPFGKTERDARLLSCRLTDVQNTLGYAFGCTAKEVLIPADWRSSRRGGAA